MEEENDQGLGMSHLTDAPASSQPKRRFNLKAPQPRGPYKPDEWQKKQAILDERKRKAELARAAEEEESEEELPLRRRRSRNATTKNAPKRGKGRK